MTADEKVLTGILVLSAALCIVFILRKLYFAKHMLIIVLCTVLALLLFDINTFIADYSQSVCATDRTITGTVYSSNSDAGSIVLSDNTVDEVKVFGKIKAYTSMASELSPGDSITLTEAYLIPAEADGTFRFHSLSDRVFLIAFTNNSTISVTSSKESIYSKILSMRTKLNDKYFSELDDKNASIVSALITGDKDSFSEEFSNDLKYSGASHIFAVSGMHLSLWTGLFFIFFRQRAKTKLLPNAAAILFVLFYCVLTGFSPSVLRSGIMLISVFAAKLIKKHADSLNTLGLSGTLLLLYNPFLAGNVSFLLSFTATFALIFFSEYILPEYNLKMISVRFLRKRIRNIVSSFMVSLCVILTTLPITALFFGYASLLSPIASIILTPLTEIVMITGSAAAVIPTGSFISAFLFGTAKLFSGLIIHICEFFGEIDIVIQATPIEFILPWYIISLLLTVSVFMRYKDRKKTLSCILSCVIVLLSVTAVINTASKDVTEIYIPAGENATMISVAHPFTHNSAIFGTGGSYSSASDTVRYLNGRGILKTDRIIIPRDKASENSYTDYLSAKLEPESTITLYENDRISKSSFELWKNAVISSVISSDCALSTLQIDEIKIVICTLPSSDFSTADSTYSSGDILITRNAVPETIDTDNFETVIIMTDREKLPLSENSYSTADGEIKIFLKGDSYVIH